MTNLLKKEDQIIGNYFEKLQCLILGNFWRIGLLFIPTFGHSKEDLKYFCTLNNAFWEIPNRWQNLVVNRTYLEAFSFELFIKKLLINFSVKYSRKLGCITGKLVSSFNVTSLGDFWNYLATNFITKVARMFGDFLGSCEIHRFLS